MPSEGQLIGDYALMGVIHATDIADIWLGKHRISGEYAAIKFPVTHAGRLQLKRDSLIARLDHPHVVRYYAVALDSARPFLTMQYVRGSTLDKTRGRLSETEAIEVVRQMTGAVLHLHERGIVHRDIATRNVALTSSSSDAAGQTTLHATLIDFGLAAATPFESGRPVGRALTMPGAEGNNFSAAMGLVAPELFNAVEPTLVDGRADIYGLGVLLAELCAGRGTLFTKDWRNHGLPPDISAVVDRCCREMPDDRFADAGELLAALESLALSYPFQGIATHPPSDDNPEEHLLTGSKGQACPRCGDDLHTRSVAGGHFCRQCEYSFKSFGSESSQPQALSHGCNDGYQESSRLLEGVHFGLESSSVLKGNRLDCDVLTMSPDGLIVAVGGYDGIFFSEVESGQELYSLTGRDNSPAMCARFIKFSPDGLRLIVFNGYSLSVWTWQSADSRRTTVPKCLWCENIPHLISVALSVDGRQVCVSCGHACAVYDTATGCPTGFLPRAGEKLEVVAIGWLDRPARLLTHQSNGSIIAWKTSDSNDQVSQPKPSNWWQPPRWWRPSTWRRPAPCLTETNRWQGEVCDIVSCAASHGGEWVATVDSRGTVLLWNSRQDDPPLLVLEDLENSQDLVFSSDDQLLAIAACDSSVPLIRANRLWAVDVSSIGVADANGNAVSVFRRTTGDVLPENIQAVLVGPLLCGTRDTGIRAGITKAGKLRLFSVQVKLVD